MDRREFIKQAGNVALTTGTMLFLAEGMLLRRAGAEPLPISGLKKLIGPDDGTVLAQKDSGFSEHRDGFNRRIQVVPRIVVLCKTPKAIAACIQWARVNGVPLRPRSGGHSYEGLSTIDGLVIDVSPMNTVSVDTVSRTARIGAGTKLGRVYEKVISKNLMMVAGSCATVGVAGLTLGGGFGMLSRKYGTTCDNLLSLRMVNAEGELLEASESVNPDLFWACRGGGGGNFGVATEFTFRLHPVKNVLVFALRWPASQAKAVIEAWQKHAPFFDDEVTSILNVTGLASGGLQPIKVGGQYVGTSESELLEILKPLTSVGTPILKKVTAKTMSEAVDYWSGGEDPPVCFKAKSDYARKPLSSEGIDELLKQLKGLKTGAIAALFDGYGGAVNRVPADATAFPHRDGTLFSVQYYSQWSSTSKSPANIEQMRKVHGAMRPHFSGHSYVNYQDLDLVDWQHAYYGDNFTRLTQVKAAYDPRNVFQGPQNIPLP
jgi:FAD/FMN-containing dehydrogenase